MRWGNRVTDEPVSTQQVCIRPAIRMRTMGQLLAHSSPLTAVLGYDVIVLRMSVIPGVVFVGSGTVSRYGVAPFSATPTRFPNVGFVAEKLLCGPRGVYLVASIRSPADLVAPRRKTLDLFSRHSVVAIEGSTWRSVLAADS